MKMFIMATRMLIMVAIYATGMIMNTVTPAFAITQAEFNKAFDVVETWDPLCSIQTQENDTVCQGYRDALDLLSEVTGGEE